MVLHCHALNNYDVIKCSDYGAVGSFAHDTNLTFSAVNLEVLQTDMSNELKRIFSSLCCDKLTLNSSMIYMLTAENGMGCEFDIFSNFPIPCPQLITHRAARCCQITQG